jgi:hypothetical protein
MDETNTSPEELQPWPRGVRKPFRAFCSEQYYVNRDEYFAFGQHQPYTMEQYIVNNLSLLKELYREQRKRTF